MPTEIMDPKTKSGCPLRPSAVAANEAMATLAKKCGEKTPSTKPMINPDAKTDKLKAEDPMDIDQAVVTMGGKFGTSPNEKTGAKKSVTIGGEIG